MTYVNDQWIGFGVVLRLCMFLFVCFETRSLMVAAFEFREFPLPLSLMYWD